MTQDEIIRMAREAGISEGQLGWYKFFQLELQHLERFAAIVREDEANKWKKDLREAIEAQGFCYACAKALDESNERMPK